MPLNRVVRQNEFQRNVSRHRDLIGPVVEFDDPITSSVGSSIQRAQITAGDVADGATADLAELDEADAATGDTIDGVINRTGVTLLDQSIVYVYRIRGHDVNQMYPAQLESCPTPLFTNPAP